MLPEPGKERSLAMATCLGCLGLSLIPLAVLAVLVGSIYMHFEQVREAEEEQLRQDRVEREAERQTRLAESAFSADEQRRLNAALSGLASADARERANAESILAELESKNPNAVSAAVVRVLGQSKDVQQLAAAAAFLCKYRGERGGRLIASQVFDRSHDRAFLSGIRKGVYEVQDAALRMLIVDRIVAQLRRAGSVYADQFDEL